MKIIRYILILLSFECFSQSFEGIYTGSLVGDKDMLLIEKNEDQYLVTLNSADIASLLSIGQVKSEYLEFELPLNNGTGLQCKAINKESSLFLEFELEGNNYKIEFIKLDRGKVKADSKVKTTENDTRLIGVWIEKQTFSLDGKVDKEMDKSAKRYKVNYLNDGRLVIDSRLFRDAFQKNGLKFNFSDIPNYYWSTRDNKFLLIHIPSINQSFESEYEIRTDSLIVNEGMVIRYYVKEKN